MISSPRTNALKIRRVANGQITPRDVLKRVLCLSSFATLRDLVSSDFCACKIQQGKRHNQALIALARRRCDVLFAMLRDGTFYQPKAAPNA